LLRLSDEVRERVAQRLCAEIRESEREKERLRERWIRLRAIHDCEENTSQVQLIEGMKPYVLPLSRTKADRIVAAVVDGITGLNPYVQVFDAGNLNANLDDIEQDLMTLAQDAGDAAAIREGAEDAVITNAGVWRVRPFVDERPYDAAQSSDASSGSGAGAKVTRLDWEAIDPVDVCCYPPYFGTFAAAKTVGHRWSELLYRVKADMASGRYATYDLKGGDDPTRSHRSADDQAEGYEAQRPADEFVELWEVVSDLDLHDDGKYRKYLCVVALTEQKLLSIQPYPYSTPWYVEVRTERERNRIFPNSSVMQRLQGLQLAYSDMFTAMIQASFASIGPITILTGGGLMSKVTQAKPFMVLEAPADVKVQSISANPQVGALPQGIEKVEEVADALTGIGRNGAGQQLPASTTATEVDAIQAAQNEAKDQYTQVVASSVERVFRLLFEFYRFHYADLKAAYGDKLVADPAFVLTVCPQFKVNGKNGSTSSMIVLQKLQMLMGLIAQTPGTRYDAAKIIDQMAQLLDLPFSLRRLEISDGVAGNGFAGPVGGAGVLPHEPFVAGVPPGVGGPPFGGAPPMFGVGFGAGGPPHAGPVPGN